MHQRCVHRWPLHLVVPLRNCNISQLSMHPPLGYAWLWDDPEDVIVITQVPVRSSRQQYCRKQLERQHGLSAGGVIRNVLKLFSARRPSLFSLGIYSDVFVYC